MTLTTEEREDAWKKYMQEASSRWEEFGNFTKADLLVAICEADDWIESGSKGLLKNNISEPCKSELTSQQMDDIENIVLNKRQGEF